MSVDSSPREIPRPDPSEYEAYYETYIGVVPDGNLFDLLVEQAESLTARLRAASAKGSYSYAPDKWSVAEVVGHLIDTERVFTCRAFCMARGDQQPFPGMDQDQYAALANYTGRSLLDEILPEYLVVRQATLGLFSSFDEAALLRTGTASGFGFSVRALCHIVVGHETHHLRVLEERYGV